MTVASDGGHVCLGGDDSDDFTVTVVLITGGGGTMKFWIVTMAILTVIFIKDKDDIQLLFWG